MISQQFAIYVAVGLLSAFVDIGIIEIILMNGVNSGLAVSTGFVAGLIVNYLCHSKVTFRVQSTTGSILRYSMVLFLNYAITMLLVMASEYWLESVLAGKIFSLPIVAVNGFLLGKYWVFK